VKKSEIRNPKAERRPKLEGRRLAGMLPRGSQCQGVDKRSGVIRQSVRGLSARVWSPAVFRDRFPSPRSFPRGRGRTVTSAFSRTRRSRLATDCVRFSLSLGRAGVRGQGACDYPSVATSATAFRASVFGLLSAFGLRISALPASLLALVLCFAALFPSPVRAQTNVAAPGAAPSNRYLLIVETSRAMQRRAEGVLKTVQELLASGLTGQAQAGDTLGIWTFNDELHAGQFPLQRWSAAEQPAITGRVLAFLQGQKYENQARLDKVLPAIVRVTKDSEFITVILVSAGTAELQGTPFDGVINQLYQRWRGQQQQAQMPFVTALRAQGGRLVDYEVTSAPWPVELPALPTALEAARRAAERAVEKPLPTPQPVPPPAAPPLIISGKKPEPTPLSPPAEMTISKPQPPVPAAPSVVVNPTLAPLNTAPPSATTAQTLPGRQPKPAPLDTPPPPTPGISASVIAPLDTRPSAASASASKVEAAPPSVGPHAEPRPSPEAAATPPASVAPGLQTAESQPAKAPGKAVASPARLEVSAPKVAAPFRPSTPSPQPSPATLPPQAQVAVSRPERTFFSQTALWIAGLACVVAVGGVLWWRFRCRPSGSASLITRSLEREK
jgi:hypothetical protein